jgi:hypothetical protein
MTRFLHIPKMLFLKINFFGGRRSRKVLNVKHKYQFSAAFLKMLGIIIIKKYFEGKAE